MCNLLEAVPHWEVCAEARDGREAVELAIRNPPDIVILDITMPELNGFEVAAQIEKRLPQVPVIMFSLHVTADVIDRFNRGTVRGAVAKSEAARDLIKAVRAVLEGGTFFRTLPTK